ncbi:ring canal kelch-like protein, partial [Dinothrombium tinctorium]
FLFDRFTKQDMDNKDKQEHIESEVEIADRLKTLLFPEPYFKEFLNETVRNIKPPLAYWDASERGKYIRYLKVWKIEAKPNVVERSMQNMKKIRDDKLITYIERVYNAEEKPFFDMEIHVEKEVFKVHRMIVACFMPHLMQRLAKTKADELQKKVCKVNMKNISLEAARNIFKYMYTGSVDPTGENFITVLESALRLYMDSFADIWIDAYECKLGLRVLQLLFRLRLARKYGWTDYISQLNSVIALDFENLLLSDKFVKLIFEELYDFLKEDEIGVQNEVVLFLAVLKWLNHDWKTRKKFAVPLMSEIRFAYMTDDELFACYNPPILKEIILIEEIKSMIAEAVYYRYKVELIKEKFPIPGAKKPRNYRFTSAPVLKLWTSDKLIEKKQSELDKLVTEQQKSFDQTKYQTSMLKMPKTKVDDKVIEEKLRSLAPPGQRVTREISIYQPERGCKCPLKHKSEKECKEAAATRIQSHYRGYHTRKDLSISLKPITSKDASDMTIESEGGCKCHLRHRSEKECKEEAATRIQAHYRGYHIRKDISLSMKSLSSKEEFDTSIESDSGCKCHLKHGSEEECKEEAAKRIQAHYRGYQTRKDLSKSLKSLSSKETSDLSMKASSIESSFKLPSSESSFDISSESEKEREFKEIDEISKHEITTPSPQSFLSSQTKGSLERKRSTETLPMDLESISQIKQKYGEPEINLNKNSPPGRIIVEVKQKLIEDVKTVHETPVKIVKAAKEAKKPIESKTLEPKQSLQTPKQLLPPFSPPKPLQASKPQISEKVSPPKITLKPITIVVFGDYLDSKDKAYIFYCNLTAENTRINEWKTFERLPREPQINFDCLITTYLNAIWITGGIRRTIKNNKPSLSASKACFRFDVKTNSLKQLRDLCEARVLHASAVVNNKLYLIGGKTSPNNVTNTVECYEKTEWTLVKTGMNVPRFGSACIAVKNRLYVIGGITKTNGSYQLLNDIKVFNPQTNTWLRMKSKLPMGIAFASAVFHSDNIYVIGGRILSSSNTLKMSDKVFRFSPFGKKWEEICPLKKARCNLFALSYGESKKM